MGMKPFVLILGDVHARDRAALDAGAASFGCDIRAHATGPAPIDGAPPPAGCISFLPCARAELLSVFGSMPVGFGHEIPFFQHVGPGEAFDIVSEFPVCGVFCSPVSVLDARNIFTIISRNDTLMRQNRDLVSELMKYRKQKHQLIAIGTSLSQHADLEELLAMILAESRDIVAADAGSIYIREKNGPGGAFTDRIRFKISQNDSVDIGTRSSESVLPIDETTVAGYVAFTGRVLNIEDVFTLGDDVPYKAARKEYERKFEYRVKSMLTAPLKNMAGEVVGVLQLMNKKTNAAGRLRSVTDVEALVTPFTLSDEDFILSIGSQAAVSIERVQLYREIQDIFEGYLRSSIAAIDERDRVTYGHSRRVMGYALAFADAVNRQNEGRFAAEHFSEQRKNEFRFAALLHDIGKIGVPEALLTKEARLTKEEMAVIKMKGELVKFVLRVKASGEPLPWTSEADVDGAIVLVEKVNSAGSIGDDDFAALTALSKKWYCDAGGTRSPFLSAHEFEALSVRNGNLTKKERERINSHAQATRRILSRIPWTRELERIPDIACHHHERLDGSGYPDGLLGERLCFESKALAVIDIYEALVAQDRPYKPKMPPDRAIEILRAEAKANHLDAGIVEFFVASGIYKIFLDEQPADETASA
jgi:HD-GYP domain-containing protein (c-di-GMP phosphodiesterase class II)